MFARPVAANAFRRIACRRDNRLCFLAVVYHWGEDSLHSDVQRPLDEYVVVGRDAGQDRDTAGGNCLKNPL